MTTDKNFTKNKEKFKRRERPSNSQLYGKVPPQAKDLEEAVLGAIMLEKRAFDVVVEILKPESFYSDANQKIFNAMFRLSQKNMPIDLMTVVEELRISEHLEIVGGPYYVSKLTNAVVSAANIEAHARIVAQKFIMREIIRMGIEMTAEAYEDSTDVFDLLNDIDRNLTELITGNQKKTYVPIQQGVIQSILRIEELRMLDNDITGTPSGFRDLDILTHGWQSTDLIILAARPSVGKTAFALNLARNAAGDFRSQYLVDKISNPLTVSKSVGFFSLEMSIGQLVNRMLSTESNILLDKISNGKLDDYQMKSLYKNAVNQLSDLPIFIDDSAALNIYELRAKCRRLKSKHNVGIIIIDYLQLMSGANEGRNGNREQEISKISRDLKGLAKELQIPIIALSQLSREPEKRKGDNKMPQLSDLRESGAIEQDADVVMFMYRPEYYDITANEMGDSNKGETHIRIAKHRNGTLSVIKLRAELSIQKFHDMDDSFNAIEKLGPGNWRPTASISSALNSNSLDDNIPF